MIRSTPARRVNSARLVAPTRIGAIRRSVCLRLSIDAIPDEHRDTVLAMMRDKTPGQVRPLFAGHERLAALDHAALPLACVVLRRSGVERSASPCTVTCTKCRYYTRMRRSPCCA